MDEQVKFFSTPLFLSSSSHFFETNKMELDKEEINYYEVLGCTMESSDKDIQRAVRKLSAKYHPDKNKAPEAEALFLKVRQASDFLMDPEKRKEYDDKFKKIAKRKEYDAKRYKNMDSRRKRMKQELEERLGKATEVPAKAESTSEKTSQTDMRRKKAELDRIRKDGMERVRTATFKQQQQQTSSIDEIAKNLRAREEELSQNIEGEGNDIYLQIKVKWKRSTESHSDDSLAQLFRQFGHIEQVSILPGKGASAVITFSEPSSAPAAVEAYALSKTFRVSIYGEPKKASIFTHVYSKDELPRRSATAQSSHFSDNIHVESDLMREVRRTMEKEALRKQLEEEELGGGTVNNDVRVPPTASTEPITSSLASDGSPVYIARDMPVGGGITYEELLKKEEEIITRLRQFSSGTVGA